MIDENLASLALRNRALSVTVVTTGSVQISATATGYHREDAGSFLTDGFVPGMEITPLGFATNTVDIITGVTATDLTTANQRSVQSAGARSISVVLPSVRAWELKDTTKVTLKWRVEEAFLPQPSRLLGQKNGGLLIEEGLYVLTIVGPEQYGTLAFRKLTGALKALYAIGTSLTAGSDAIRIGDVNGGTTQRGPYAGQVIPQGDGSARCVLTIPWYSMTSNQVAA